MSQKQGFFAAMGGLVNFYHGKYNITSDPVWLAAFAPSAKTVLDVGIGTGGVALCYLAHNPNAKVTGIDISDEMLLMAKNNSELNNRATELINQDIINWKTDRTFDLVLTNPPYFKGTPAGHNAHHNADISKWTKQCIKRVRPRGYFCTIVDVTVMAEVVTSLSGFGDIIIVPLFGAKNTAERVLIQARQGVKGGVTIYSGLAMNYEPVLRDGLTIKEVLATLVSKC